VSLVRIRIVRLPASTIYIYANDGKPLSCKKDTFDAEPRILVSKKSCSSNFILIVLIGSFVPRNVVGVDCDICQQQLHHDSSIAMNSNNDYTTTQLHNYTTSTNIKLLKKRNTGTRERKHQEDDEK
jgi:hypothetical protein